MPNDRLTLLQKIRFVVVLLAISSCVSVLLSQSSHNNCICDGGGEQEVRVIVSSSSNNNNIVDDVGNDSDGSASNDDDDDDDDDDVVVVGRRRAPPPTNDVINYGLQSGRFVKVFAECVVDPSCHVYFNHLGKTGGTSLETFMDRLVNRGSAYFSRRSCCGEIMMSRFRNSVKFHCNAKFSSYQVNARQFDEVLDTCLGPPDDDVVASASNSSRGGRGGTARRRRAVVLISVREPLGRYVSHVHQWCNKMYEKMRPGMQRACRNCDYNARRDRGEWDDLVRTSDSLYRAVAHVMSTRRDYAENLLIDVADISDFFERLLTLLARYASSSPSGNGKSAPPFHIFSASSIARENRESKQICDFSLTSELIKKLSKSSDIYRAVTLGLYNITS